MSYNRPSSFSQNMLFVQCPRTWYMKYVQKIPGIEDLVYAHRGNVVHHCLEKYYPDKQMTQEEVKELFEKEWKSFKLDESKLKNKKDETWLMILRGMELDLHVTSTELKIFYPDVVAYIDVLNTRDGIIDDWKTSTRSEHNEQEYMMQVKFYAWLYHRKFGKLPSEANVKYLKYTGTKAVLGCKPTMEDIENAKKWHFHCRERMNYYVKHPNKLPPFNKNYFFCPYKHLWDLDDKSPDQIMKFVIDVYGNFFYIKGDVDKFLSNHFNKKYSYELKTAFFIKKANPNANTTVRFWLESRGRLPIGFLEEVKKSLHDYAEFKNKTPVIVINDRRVLDENLVTMPDELLSGKTLRPYQVDAIDTYVNRNKVAMLELSTGGGKCFAPGTEVIMFDGSIKKVEDVRVGDKLMGDDSMPRTVTSLASGEEMMYDIIPVKGDKYTVNESHILSLKYTPSSFKYKLKNGFIKQGFDKKSNKKIDISINEYLNKTNTDKHRLKGYRVPIDFKERKLNIDPYFLGLWLGDGYSKYIEVCNPENEIKKYIEEYANKLNIGYREIIDKRNNNSNTLKITNGRGSNNNLHDLFKKNKLLDNKHIPKDFLINSRENRLQLLAGLIDTDGYMHNNVVEIIQKSKKLTDDILFLTRSLGFAAYTSTKIGKIKSLNFEGKYYRINISGDLSKIPLKVKRKIPFIRKQKKDVLVTGIKVEPVGVGKYYGFTLSGNNRRFLLKDFTVVHNTLIAAEIIRRLGCKTLFIVDKKELLYQAKETFETNLGIEIGVIGDGKKEIKDITVATIQTLNKNLKDFKDYLNTVRFVCMDEAHKVAAKSYYKIGTYMKNTEYRLGITATAFRDDGNDMMLTATLGNICYSLTGQELIEQGYLMKPDIIFLKYNIPKEEHEKMESESLRGLINETPQYGMFYPNFIVNNKYRNEAIKNICEKENGKTILILVKLIEHGKLLEELLPDSMYIYGETASLVRTKALSDFKSGKLKVLISTISIFAEGVDIPALDVVINAAANKGDIKSIQVLGRVLRRKEGKEKAMYYDFADVGKFFYTASRARAEAFKNEGHSVRYEELE